MRPETVYALSATTFSIVIIVVALILFLLW